MKGVSQVVLILCPTRELALQLSGELSIASHVTVAVAIIVGGLELMKQVRFLSRRPLIVLGTPGRLWGLVSSELSFMYTVFVLIKACL